MTRRDKDVSKFVCPTYKLARLKVSRRERDKNPNLAATRKVDQSRLSISEIRVSVSICRDRVSSNRYSRRRALLDNAATLIRSDGSSFADEASKLQLPIWAAVRRARNRGDDAAPRFSSLASITEMRR